MRFTIFLILFLAAPAQSAQTTCEELAEEYVPQSAPEETYRLELRLLAQGMYCYNLPIFDSVWREKGNTISFSSQNKHTADMFDQPFETHIEGSYAIIYYPQDFHLGPAFLYEDTDGWVLDRTTVIEKIHYGNEWLADEGDYPYLELLKDVFQLEQGRSNRGVIVYKPVR